MHRRASTSPTWGAALLSLLAFIVHPPAATAGGFLVSPTLAEVRAGARVASFELANRGDAPVAVQVDALAWSQDGEDVLAPAQDLVIAPRRVEIAPGASRLVRLALNPDVAEETGERAYRVRFRELPGAGAAPRDGFGIATLVEHNVPLFFNVGRAPDLHLRAWRDEAGRLILEAANAGTRYARLAGMRVWDGAGTLAYEHNGPRYVLAARTMRWTLPDDVRIGSGETAQVQFAGDSGKRTVLVE
ncbi:molecular chaperone [Coralloluteibacterium thermophilus]|uniref:Molecular chaperone n=1 Tax=Coralloluteibacterium thermophilum TaxID=2707049 RepID=A0ABV9NKG9_9GAMM